MFYRFLLSLIERLEDDHQYKILLDWWCGAGGLKDKGPLKAPPIIPKYVQKSKETQLAEGSTLLQ